VPSPKFGAVVNGVVFGTAVQLLGLYAREDLLSAIVGTFLLAIGIFIRHFSEKPLPSPPSPSDNAAYEKYKMELSNRKVLERLDFVAFGGTMVVIEIVAVVLYYLTGLHFPVASS
jgi:hypothetical protein